MPNRRVEKRSEVQECYSLLYVVHAICRPTKKQSYGTLHVYMYKYLYLHCSHFTREGNNVLRDGPYT